MELDARVDRLEQQYTAMVDRISKVEDKSAGAWNTIREVNGRMDRLEDTVKDIKKEQQDIKKEQQGIKEDVKIMKQQQNDTNKTLKVLVGVVSVLCVICIGFFIYIWRHDAELAKSILTLGSTVAHAVT